ncbi:hypothetical protein [Candidatus Pelagisphaera phototrophica]|uniref:hypothetical protein n=1 Tax=Candidatus Pelagisphaera phototrophica TaxID=2684113 RepID=UPI001A064D26|nr:hypothetical protein [Candidatus Pelagisphaera phototrophica]QXD31112.1 hypothetical protein GA004_12285 [Candidatus Pelagisphaera phototrophica]
MIRSKRPPFAQITFWLVCTPLLSLSETCATWLPNTDEELSFTGCAIDPNAGVKVLYKSIEFDDDSGDANYRKYYVRLKICDADRARGTELNKISYSTSNVTDPFNPIKVAFNLEPMPFADVVGKRIFLQTNVFRKKSEPEFPESKRLNDLRFG